MNSPGIILYFKYAEAISMMDDEDAGKLLKVLVNYKNEETTTLTGAALIVYSIMKNDIENCEKKYSDKVERMRELGRKGGKKSGSERMKKSTKIEACEAYASHASKSVENNDNKSTNSPTVTMEIDENEAYASFASKNSDENEEREAKIKENKIKENKIKENKIKENNSLYKRECAFAQGSAGESDSVMRLSKTSETDKSYDLEEFLNANLKWSEGQSGKEN